MFSERSVVSGLTAHVLIWLSASLNIEVPFNLAISFTDGTHATQCATVAHTETEELMMNEQSDI